MKVSQMLNSKGVPVRNQFILSGNGKSIFQSYNSIICEKEEYTPYDDTCGKPSIKLDEVYWNYSRTTSKYRSLFLGETTKETERKIKSGEYILTNLN